MVTMTIITDGSISSISNGCDGAHYGWIVVLAVVVDLTILMIVVGCCGCNSGDDGGGVAVHNN